MEAVVQFTVPVVQSIIASVLEKIVEWCSRKAGGKFGAGDRFDRIVRELEKMRDVLNEASEGQGKEFKALVAAMRDAAYEADDAIDMYVWTEQRNRQRLLGTHVFKRREDLTNIFHEIDQKIEVVRNAIADIHSMRSLYALQQTPTRGELRDREDVDFAVGGNVIGFEQNANELVEKLTSGDTHRRVVSIVAMGGAGKTTLARKVYKDSRITSRFQDGYTAWVSLSQTGNVQGALKDLAKQMMCMPVQELEQLNSIDLKDRLSEFLKEKKYLIVLDDVSETDQWEKLKRAFPDVQNGSRIMLTTRRMRVASRASCDPANRPYKLRPLSDDDSRNLLLNKAHQLSCPFKEIETLILAKCCGLPIAIELIGEQLAKTERQRNDWENALDSLEEHLFTCPKMRALGHYDLPRSLKLCFLSFVLFPQGDIDAEKLKMIWVADGFVEGVDDRQKENTAEWCLKDLIDSSIIQVVAREWDGTVVKCRIHGLIRGLAMLEASEYRFLGMEEKTSPSLYYLSETVRRLSLNRVRIHPRYHTKGHHSAPKLRTFLCFTRFAWNLKVSNLVRVLDLEGVESREDEMMEDVITLIKKSIFLKYLNLKNINLNNLPLSTDKHLNLETLLINESTRLPKAIWKMKRLRYLYYFGLQFEGSPQFDCLTSLQTLHLQAGPWINKLSSLSGLRKLHIRGDESSNLNALWSSIEQLTQLESLVLEFPSEKLLLRSLEHHSKLKEMLLEVGLERLPRVQEFPPNLTKLNLQDSRLRVDPMATLGELPTLESLRLGRDSYRGRIMTSAGFPVLRYLQLESLNEVEEWRAEEGSMPRLKSCQIDGCERLRTPESLQHIIPRRIKRPRIQQ